MEEEEGQASLWILFQGNKTPASTELTDLYIAAVSQAQGHSHQFVQGDTHTEWYLWNFQIDYLHIQRMHI